MDGGLNGFLRDARASSWATGLLAFLAYSFVSVLLLGRGVIASPDDRVVGDAGSDKTIFMWAFEWWPRALAAGHDPLSAPVVWAPRGMDLSWVAAIPGAAYLAAPVTYAFGPVVSYNTFALLAPATAAWAAFLLARWVTSAFWPSLVAGFLFGFSSFEIGQSIGHLHLTIVAAIPLAVLLALCRFTGEIAARRYILLQSLALAFQFLVSTELFLMLVGMSIAALALGWWILERERRTLLRGISFETLAALGLTTLLVSPYLVHALVLTGPTWAPTRDPFDATADLGNFAIPRHWTWLQPPWADQIARRFSANPVESTAYLGLPLLAIVVLFACRRQHRRGHVLLLALLGVAFAFSLGPWVRLAGTTIAVGPGYVLAHLPVARSALPVRLTVFVALLCALICAVWLAERRRSPLRWALALAAVVALLPTPSTSFWSADVERARFFTEGNAERRFDRDDIVLVLPYGRSGWSMLWQAEDDFAFRMAGGRLGSLPPEEQKWLPALRALAGAKPTREASRQLPAFLKAHHVDAIVVIPSQTRDRVERLVASLGGQPVREADALVYELTRGR